MIFYVALHRNSTYCKNDNWTVVNWSEHGTPVVDLQRIAGTRGYMVLDPLDNENSLTIEGNNIWYFDSSNGISDQYMYVIASNNTQKYLRINSDETDLTTDFNHKSNINIL